MSIAVDVHCKFNDNFGKAELLCIKDAALAVAKYDDDSTSTKEHKKYSQKCVLSFNEFVNDPAKMARIMHECYDLDGLSTLVKELDDELPKLKRY